MVIASYAASPGAVLAIRTVTAVAADGTSVTIASGDETEFPDNGVITKGVTRSSVNEGSWDIEPMGLIGLIDDTTFRSTIHGLNRSTVTLFQANVFTSALLNELVFWRAFDKCDEESGMEPNWLVCHHSVHRAYVNLTLPDKRYSGENLMRPDAGISGGGKKHELTFSGTAIEKERFAPYGQLFGVDSTQLKKYENVPGKWADEDGAVLDRVPGKDVFQAYYRKFGNYSTMQANSSFIIKGINATVDVVKAL
jgi:hypothetical protein